MQYKARLNVEAGSPRGGMSIGTSLQSTFVLLA